MHNELSNRENDFIEILNTVECMSVYEADIIMERYLNCSPGQVKKILNHLKSLDLLSVTKDGRYIVAGSREKSLGDKALSSDMVFAIWIALKQFEKDKEDSDAVMYMHKPTGGGTLAFISNGQLYRVHTVTSRDIFKIRLVEEKYKKKSKRLNEDRFVKNSNYEEISYFAFAEPHRDDYILEKVGELDLEIPHAIWVLKKGDLAEEIECTKYSEEE